MYLSHFGLTAFPFQLQPDPAFLFESRGYHYTHQYLRYGLMQKSGFVVLTGEIGAGKTTLTQAFLAELDPARITPAMLVSAQLDANSLLLAIGQTFGFALPQQPTAAREELETRLGDLLATGRRALLLIDEAQHLSRDALEFLQTFCDMRRDGAALLQCYLIGQPELREALQARSLEPLRQRIIAGCHLGPLDSTEVQPYIEHRLRCAGWSGNPAFSAEAYARITAWTGGIPRRINLLCNRLLMDAFVENRERIEAGQVESVARVIHEETGGLLPPVDADKSASSASAPAPAAATARAADEPTLPAPTADLQPQTDRAEPEQLGLLVAAPRRNDARVLLCVAQTPDARLVMQTLAERLQVDATLPRPLIVAPAPVDSEPLLCAPDVPLSASTGLPQDLPRWIGECLAQLAQRPVAAVLAAGAGDAVLAAALAAHRAGVPVIAVAAGQRRGDRHDPAEVDRALLDRLAGLHLVADAVDAEVLAAEGAAPASIEWVGNARIDAVHAALAATPDVSRTAYAAHLAAQGWLGEQGYALLFAQDAAGYTRERLVDWLANVRRLSRVIPVVLAETPALRAALTGQGLSQALNGARVWRIDAPALADTLALLRAARCALTDRPLLADAARLLGVPHLELRRNAGRRALWGPPQRLGCDFGWMVTAVIDLLDAPAASPETLPLGWDGQTAERIAGVLAAWLPAEEATAQGAETGLKVG